MTELHFKKGLYKYYSPYLYRMYKFKAALDLWRWNIDFVHLTQLAQVYWNQYLGRKFVGEIEYFGGQPYTGHNLTGKDQGNAFILGCGPSINSITPAEWQVISNGFTVGLNAFFVHEYTADAYLSEFSDLDSFYDIIYPRLLNNPDRKSSQVYLSAKYVLLRATKYVHPTVQTPFFYIANWVKLLDEGLLAKILTPYFSRNTNRGGLSHYISNTDTAINFCVRKGHKNIYLVGVDLANNGYFWDVGDQEIYQKARCFIDQLRGNKVPVADKQELHFAASKSIAAIRGHFTLIEYLNFLQKTILAPLGVQLYVCNPSSLLADVLPYVAIQDIKKVE